MILFPKEYQAKRVTITRPNGVAHKQSEVITFIGNCQPTSGRQIDPMLVERHQMGFIQCWTMEPLNVSQEGSDKPGDVILWDGSEWEVVQELPRKGEILGPGTTHKFIAARR